jgi:tRNA1(Val) A37 N6-methylase TrmN6
MRRSLLGSNLIIEQFGKQAFNLDTILLQHFAKVPYKAKIVLDIGTGVGALMLYLSEKTTAKIIGVEIQEDRFNQAVKNIKLNDLDDRLECINDDIKKLDFKNIDFIISNPPFFKVNETSNLSVAKEEQIARHEVCLTLDELAYNASRFLKQSGIFTLIHRPDRLEEIIKTFTKYDLVIKRLRFVHPYKNKRANHVLIEAAKMGKSGLIVEAPLILYSEKNKMTEELINIYGGL